MPEGPLGVRRPLVEGDDCFILLTAPINLTDETVSRPSGQISNLIIDEFEISPRRVSIISPQAATFDLFLVVVTGDRAAVSELDRDSGRIESTINGTDFAQTSVVIVRAGDPSEIREQMEEEPEDVSELFEP